MEHFTAQQFLAVLITAGGAGSVVSYLLKYVKNFEAIDNPDLKKLIVGGLTSLVAVLAYVGITYIPKELFDAINPYVAIIAPIILSYVSSQWFHANYGA